MYSTCLFCHSPLGTNATIERFPVGRRLAFDAARGRLWVVCRACERWNLSPLEDRWEALEDCERRFRDTRLRVSTDNIGLARPNERLELVRVGPALRPELAAWRYGDQFGRRRRRAMVRLGAGALGAAALGLGGIAAGAITVSSAWSLINVSNGLHGWYENKRVVGRVRVVTGETLVLHGADVNSARLIVNGTEASGRWSLRVPRDGRSHNLEGPDAMQAASVLLMRLNRRGANRAQVREAVTELERGGDAARCFEAAALASRARRLGRMRELPIEIRLALEMAIHEDSERRALEGELAELDQAWREAEEIAAIADNLLLPPGIEEVLAGYRARTRD